MRRKLISLLAVLLILACTAFPAAAASPRLADQAGLLSTAESQTLETLLNEISARYGVDLVIVTADSTGGKSPMEYADDYYDYHDYSADGVLLLVSMEERDWWISTTGYGIRAFTDAGIEYIGGKVTAFLSDSDYAGAFETFAQLCDSFLAQAKSGDPYDSHNLPREPFAIGMNLGLALAAGLAAAFFITSSMKNKLKSVALRNQANDYVTPGSLDITHSRDFHLYTRLDRSEKAQSTGGSSTHTSSSGVTHGGGGGKF